MFKTFLKFFNRTDADSTTSENAETEYIICSAIKRKERREALREPYSGNNDILDVEIGLRHHDIFCRFPDELRKDIKSQGFLTSFGRFVDRIEAMKVAFEAGQIKAEDAFLIGKAEKYSDSDYRSKFSCLFSENLY